MIVDCVYTDMAAIPPPAAYSSDQPSSSSSSSGGGGGGGGNQDTNTDESMCVTELKIKISQSFISSRNTIIGFPIGNVQ